MATDIAAGWIEVDAPRRTNKREPSAAELERRQKDAEQSEASLKSKRARLKQEHARAVTGEAEYAEVQARGSSIDGEIMRLLGVVNELERQLGGKVVNDPLAILDAQASVAAELAERRKEREKLDKTLRALASNFSEFGNASMISSDLYISSHLDLRAAHCALQSVVAWSGRRIAGLRELAASPLVAAELRAMEALESRLAQEAEQAYRAALDE